MTSPLYPWQHEAWRQLQQMRERLPHALLLHGAAGTGKTAFAEAFAQSLLCESRDGEGHACGKCQSCGWFSQYAHPDYRRVRPEVLDDEEGAEGEESEEPKKAAKSKAPSKDIRVEQIRALGDFMNVSTHRAGLRVVLMYPAEAVNTVSANAFLKTLEEPPPGTVMILVSNGLDRLLPTILSRCRKFALPMPSADEARAWLGAEGVKDAERWLAEQGGAPLAALAAAQAEDAEAADEFLAHLARPGAEMALKAAEKLAKTVAQADLVVLLQRWLADMVSQQLAGRIRYYPRYKKELAALAARVPASELLRFAKATSDRRAIAEHPLAARLFIEDMLLQYATLFTERSHGR